MDMAVISSGVAALNFAKDALQVALKIKVDNESREKISAALEQLGTAQDTLFQLREELFRLQTESAKLTEQLKAIDEWKARSQSYRLFEAPGGGMVYRSEPSDASPRHYACPRCFEQRTIQILQVDTVRTSTGKFFCPACKSPYQVNKETAF
jgi:hypothetical protein